MSGAEHRVLGILPAHLDPARHGERGDVDDRDGVVLLDRGGQPLAVGREVDGLGGIAEVDLRDLLAAGQVQTTSALAVWSLTKSRLPSGATAIPRGFWPTLSVSTTLSVAVSITLIVAEPSLGT
jgi:hypothetical protein